jgi:hypothetical protein
MSNKDSCNEYEWSEAYEHWDPDRDYYAEWWNGLTWYEKLREHLRRRWHRITWKLEVCQACKRRYFIGNHKDCIPF